MSWGFPIYGGSLLERQVWNIYCLCYEEKPCLVILNGMAGSSDGVSPLNRVFSSSLDPGETWYALNAALCSGKPSNFCSSSSAKLFADEYRLVDLPDLRGDEGVPASYSWFCSFRRTEKVHVATAFGLLLGILRQRTQEDCPFIRSDYFKALMAAINSFEFNHEDRSESADEIRLKSHVAAIEAQLSSPAKEILTLRSQLRSGQSFLQYSPTNTPPISPCSSLPPKIQSPPNLKRRRTIEEIEADPDLLPETKRKKN